MTAEGADGRVVPLGRFTAADFPTTTGEHHLAVNLELPASLLAGDAWHIRFAIAHGRHNGEFALSDLRFEANLADGPPTDVDLARTYLEHIQANSPLTRYAPGIEPILGKILYGFAANAADAGGPVGSPGDMARFLADHPGIRPVYRLSDSSGKERFAFYDPFLEDPFLRPSPTRPEVVRAEGPARNVSGLKLQGRLVAPTVELFGAHLLLPLRTPPGTSIALNPGADGQLTLEARLTDAEFDAGQFESFDNIRKLPGDTLTCATHDGPCFATYHLESHYPMTSLRMVWYPRCFGEKGDATYARLSVSLDGGPFQLVDQLPGDGREHWLVPVSRTVVLPLSRPATSALLRLDLSGDAANMTTPHGYPFIFEADVDARSMPTPVSDSSATSLAVQGDPNNNFGILPLDAPIRFYPLLDSRR